MSPTDRRTFLKASANAMGALGAYSALPAFELVTPPWVPTDTVRLGVAGCGPWGRKILDELAKLPGAEVVAIAEPVESRRASGGRKAPEAAQHADLAAMLAAHSDLDAVVVATPTHRHADHAIAVIEDGLHVYCEAPMAATEEDLVRIAEAARNSFGLFQCGLTARTNPLYAHARDFFRAGHIRDLVSFRAQRHEKTDWRNPARKPADEAALNWRLDPELTLGLAGEWATHQLDVFHWFLGESPKSVRGSGSIQVHDDGRRVPDTVHLEFEFQRGRRLQWQGTLGNSFESTYEVFYGSMGAIKLAQTAGWMFKEPDAATQGWEVYANRQQFHDQQGITLVVDATQLAAQERLKEGVGLRETPLYFALEAFLAAVLEGGTIESDARNGVRASAVGIAAARAVATGETVAIDPELWE